MKETVRMTHHRYAAAGRVVLPIAPGTKRTPMPDWSDPARVEFEVSEEDGLAWRLDAIIDFDLDNECAMRLAEYFLPRTPCKWGRASLGLPSHWGYKGAGIEYKKYQSAKGVTLLEIRAGNKFYTVVPPSVLPESKGRAAEACAWFEEGDPTEIASIAARRCGDLLAVATELALALGKWGFGHDARLEVAGFLLRHRVTEAEAITIGLAISCWCENSELDDVRLSVTTTATRLGQDGKGAKGGPSLAKRLGEGGSKVVAKVVEWLGGGQSVAAVDVPEGMHPLTESGDTERFAELNGDKLRFDHLRERWLLFNGHVWAPECDGEVHRMALAAMRVRQAESLDLDAKELREAALKWALGGESRSRIENMLHLAKNTYPLADDGEHWDLDPWLAGTNGGIIDLKTGEMRDGAPEDRITMRVRTEFDVHAQCPIWDRTIREVFGNDQQMIDYFDRFVGYSLTGDCREEALAVCWGDGANGKGTLMNTIAWCFGDYADDLPFSTFEDQSRTSIPNDVAKIVGKRFVTSSETSEAKRLNEARVKALTGRDPITARFLHKEFFTFQPAAKFWLATNHKPEVKDDSPGFWRRIHLLPFEQSFEGREDRTLKDQLKEELPGILARAVRGAVAWQKLGLAAPANVKAASKVWRDESDVLAPFFEEKCIIEQGAKIKASVLHMAYLQWAHSQGIKDALNMKEFGIRIRKIFSVDTGKPNVYYLGIGLRDDTYQEGGDRF